MTILFLKYYALVFIITCSLCWILIRFPLSRLLDKSGDRSLHQGLIPRSGGLAILLAIVAGWFLFMPYIQNLLAMPVLLAIVLLCVVSLLDDFFSLSSLLRFLCQLLVAVLIVVGGKLYFNFGGWLPLSIAMCLTVFGLVWMINLYNFMDGMDGFAAGMAMIAFSTLALLGHIHGDGAYAALNLVMVVAVSGFWCFNFPPAKIFMGDLGSTLLGVLAGVFSLLGWQRGLFPLWVPAVLFSPFWVDATYTVLKRMFRHEQFWLPHRQHIYQRLVLGGRGHRPVVLLEYLLMLACALSIVLPLWAGLGYNSAVPCGWALLYIIGLPLLETRLSKQG